MPASRDFEAPNPAVAAAMASVTAATAHAQADPTRPVYHFLPPANWMNDPNGPIFYDGFYHLFYQHNPYGDDWGHMHWGHARSRDLVTWEHLPIALWPSLDLGEEHVFSGCARLDAAGTPLLFYTSVKRGAQETRPANEQWAASPLDGEWRTWQKHPANPILALETHGGPHFERDWRDPFIFDAAGRTFLVLGAEYDDVAAVPLYEAEDGSLLRWRYRGLLYQEVRRPGRFLECPNFALVPAHDATAQPQWMLITSPYGLLEYMTGAFAPETSTFTPACHGILDAGQGESPNFYASNLVEDGAGNCILLGWVRGFAPGHGWNGCLALPRLLTVDADGQPRQIPLPALAQLRGHAWTPGLHRLEETIQPLDGVAGDALELQATITLDTAAAAGLRLAAAHDGSEGIEIGFDGEALHVAGCAVPLPAGPRRTVEVRVFLDRSVLELFADDGRIAVTRVVDPPLAGQAVALFAAGGTAQVAVTGIWPLRSIW